MCSLTYMYVLENNLIMIERRTQCLEAEVEAFYGLRTGIDWKGCPQVLVGVGEEEHHPRDPLGKAHQGHQVLDLTGGKG